jgi:hypothetical protein
LLLTFPIHGRIPIKYLDSAHDKAVEFIEDVHAKFYGPFTNDEVPNNDQSSRYVITESSPTSIEKELVGPNTEPSTPPACFITMENSSTGCDTDAHKTQSESFSTKSTGLSSMNHMYPENNLSEGAHIDLNDLCILPEDISTTRIYGTHFCNRHFISVYLSASSFLTNYFSLRPPPPPPDSSEEVILWNPVSSLKPQRSHGSCFYETISNF